MKRRFGTEARAALWLALAVCFIALALRAASGDVLQLDVSIARWVQGLPEVAGALFDAENWFGSGWPLGAVTIVLALALLRRGNWTSASLVLLTIVPRMLDDLIKRLVSEPRPSASFVHVDFPHDNLSFPSGHVIGITLVFGLAIIFASRLSDSRFVVTLVRCVSVLLIATIGLARIWAGAHWPSDAIGGYLYATLFLFPALLLSRERAVGAQHAEPLRPV